MALTGIDRRQVLDRISTKFAVDAEGCFVWTGFRMGHSKRNGGLAIKRKQYLAHRLAYELVVGEVPVGLELDHLCKNPLCINPDHLEPVTHRENVLRGDGWAGTKARQTHCIRGHALSGTNLRVDKNGRRICITCIAVRRRNRETDRH